MYDRLFVIPNLNRPEENKNIFDYLNPKSLTVLPKCKVEPSLAGAKPGSTFQFEREGFFCVDSDSSGENLVFNLTVPLRDTWAKIEEQNKQG